MTLKVIMRDLMNRTTPIPTLYIKTLAAPNLLPEIVLNSVFLKARKAAPCLVILEDIESIVTEQVRSYFFNQLDGLESNEGIAIVGSTNDCKSI
jgi:transitional endoplasmic reticulum ATPase